MKRFLLFALCLLSLFAPRLWADNCPTDATYSIRQNTGTLATLGVTTCYYIAASGNDSGAGTKLSPWAHLPGMLNWSGSHTPVAGDGYILKGGDTWGATSLGVSWVWSGTSSHPIYIGTDANFYTGSLWSRPIFNAGSSVISGAHFVFMNNGSNAVWTTFDNIEEKGWSCAAMPSGTMNGTISPDAEFVRMYVHGWSYANGDSSCQVFAFGANISNGTSQVAGALFDRNVVDGADQVPAASNHLSPVGCVLHADIFANNVCNYTYNINGIFNQLYGNLIENMVPGNSGDHCNMSNIQSSFSSSNMVAYNNVYNGNFCAGGLDLWLSGNSCSTVNYYAWNNVFLNVDSGSAQLITTGTHPAQGTACGNYYVFNNTAFGSNGGQLTGNGESPQHGHVYLANNHLIGNLTASLNVGVAVTDFGNELIQTTAVASANTSPHFDQYSTSETYAGAPLAATNSSVDAGQNAASAMGITCTGIFAAACSGTTYTTYDTFNHVAVQKTAVARTSSDIGAFEFGSTQGQVGAIQFLPAPGNYYPGGTSVGLSTSTIGATICFSFDGVTVPTTDGAGHCLNGSLYFSPHTISTTQTIMAVGTMAGDADSPVASAVYSMTPNTISLVSHQITAPPVVDCENVCPAQTLSMTVSSGDVVTLAVSHSGTSTAAAYLAQNGISCSPSIGNWVYPPQTRQWDSGSYGESGAYVKVNANATNASCVVTMTGPSPYTIIAAGQLRSSKGTLNVAAIPASVVTAACTTCTAPGATLSVTNAAVMSYGSPQGQIFGCNSPFTPADVDNAAYTFAAYNINTTVGDGATCTQNNPHPITAGSFILTDDTLTQAATPTFQTAPGSYASPQSVPLADATTGATICWTSDGSTPTGDGAGHCINGTTYSGVLVVSTSQTVNAIATSPGSLDSNMLTGSFVIGATPTLTGHVVGTNTVVSTGNQFQ